MFSSCVNEHLYGLVQGFFSEQQASGRINLRLPSGTPLEPSRTIKNPMLFDENLHNFTSGTLATYPQR
jgi:hypothetical protein